MTNSKVEQHINDIQGAIERDLPGWRLSQESIDQIRKNSSIKSQDERQNFKDKIQLILDRDMPGWMLSEFSLKQIETVADYQKLTTFRATPKKNPKFDKVVGIQNGKIFMFQG